MMDHVKSEFGKLDIFVSNARPEIPEFYKPPMEIRVEQWQQAINSQATAFLLGAQLAAPMMGRGGRIIAITHSPGARSGSWQPWVGMDRQKRHGVSGALLRRRPCQAWYHRELTQPWRHLRCS